MASFIPNRQIEIAQIYRKPDTPVLQLIATGDYKSKINIQQFKSQAAFPGPALSIADRNKKPNEEIAIKPITQNKIDTRFYNPKNHLSPFSVTSDIVGKDKDLSLNSLHSTRILNRKLAAVNESKAPISESGKQVNKNDFNQLRKYSSLAQMSSEPQNQRNLSLAENRNYISQNENQFYKSNKIFYKPTTSYNKYSFSTPDYFRVDDKSINIILISIELNMIKTGSNVFKPGETVTVISRSNGWLTVDPLSMSRKNCLDKQSMTGSLHRSSHMSPSWMQTDASRDEQQLKAFKPLTTIRQNVRCENNRILLADKQEPPKSIFNLGQIRHNVLTREEAQKQVEQIKNAVVQRPARLLEWQEDSNKQKYDSSKVTGKIGRE